MKYIEGYCRTNLDDYNCGVVTKFAQLPRIGDTVRVLKNGNSSTLKVCQVTHDQSNGKPIILVELHH